MTLHQDFVSIENYLKNYKNNDNDEKDINILLNVLQCPIFKSVITIQNSLCELKESCSKNPSILPIDFDIDCLTGKLNLKLPIEQDKQIDNNQINKNEDFDNYIDHLSKEKDIFKVNLFKIEDGSLGFKVVGLSSELNENLGIFIENIAENGIVDRDGRLQEGDQIIAINKQILDNISYNDAISILQNVHGSIDLVVARNLNLNDEMNFKNLINSVSIKKSLNNLNLNHEEKLIIDENSTKSENIQNEGFDNFSQIELIELVNDGTGLGFGIVGGRSTGVVVKTILAGGVSDRDGRLKSGDHILQINDVSLRGMTSEQVAQILRTAGSNVKLLVARQKLNLGYTQGTEKEQIFKRDFEDKIEKNNEEKNVNNLNTDTIETDEIIEENNDDDILNEKSDVEIETVEVELMKDEKGLGITIAGYVCEKEDISGIFVKSIAPDSAADMCNKIQLNDQIIEVDGISLFRYSNHKAVEILRNTGQIVKLKLARYLKGNKYDRLQLAINNADFGVLKPQLPVKPTILSVNNEEKNIKEVSNVDNNEQLINSFDEKSNKSYWEKNIRTDHDIIVAHIKKFSDNSGLGISLEGTIDIENGKEVRSHHLIKSILENGPVGINGKLKPGDEILQVNNSKVTTFKHSQVVELLKELPLDSVIICARSKFLDNYKEENDCVDNFSNDNLYKGLLSTVDEISIGERLVKAKSDGSLAIVTSNLELLKLKSRSLEPLTALAMWSSQPQLIELVKGERGLGFSILDYQDPMNPSETVIVIRSLVHGGVAQQDGRLIPGDRLLAVNDISLSNASLDIAVQALKGAPRGMVQILVAKPLPLTTEQSSNSQSKNYNLKNGFFFNKQQESTLDSQNQLEQQCDLSENKANLNFFKKSFESVETIDLNMDKSFINSEDSLLINRSQSYTPLSVQCNIFNDFDEDFGYSEIPIPIELENLINVQKKNLPLGVVFELSEQGINGLVIRSLSKNGAFYKDNRINVGDNLIAINHESLRNATNSKAKAILKRVNLINGEIMVKYVKEKDSLFYRTSSSLRKNKIRNGSRYSLPILKNFCRTPSPTQKNMFNFNNRIFKNSINQVI